MHSVVGPGADRQRRHRTGEAGGPPINPALGSAGVSIQPALQSANPNPRGSAGGPWCLQRPSHTFSASCARSPARAAVTCAWGAPTLATSFPYRHEGPAGQSAAAGGGRWGTARPGRRCVFGRPWWILDWSIVVLGLLATLPQLRESAAAGSPRMARPLLPRIARPAPAALHAMGNRVMPAAGPDRLPPTCPRCRSRSRPSACHQPPVRLVSPLPQPSRARRRPGGLLLPGGHPRQQPRRPRRWVGQARLPTHGAQLACSQWPVRLASADTCICCICDGDSAPLVA